MLTTDQLHDILPEYVNNDSLTIRKIDKEVIVSYGGLKVTGDDLQGALYAMMIELQARNVL